MGQRHFDLVVLGAGPGGYVTAIRAAQLGLKTAVIEEKYWGGVCLNVGCIPSKALLRNAELAHLFQNEADFFGIKVDGKVEFDFGKAHSRSREVADGRVKGVHYLMKKNKITELNGRGTFTDDHTVEVSGEDGATETVTFDHAVIAAGSSTKLLPGTELSERVVTYEEQILTDTLPESIVIAGAGAIGVEFAYVLANYGVDVTIVEFLDRLVPTEDEEVSKELGRAYKKLGVKVMTSTRVESVEDTGEGVRVTVSGGGKEQTLEADKLLQAIGFAPNVEGYGLEKTGVELTDRGAIGIDSRGRTNVPHIFAIGDVTAKLMLAHTAEAMGIVAAETIAGAETQEIDYRFIPRATYCQPQIASFGYSEKEAREAGFDVQVAKFPFMANGKAHGLGDTRGFVKILSDGKYGEFLGAHMIGPDVTELLPELTLAQQWDLTVHEVARNIHAHPTLSEAVKEAVHGLAGHMINM
ncbi:MULTISPECIES: dihydrolipoyl dehydrogenase [Nocardiopsis]|jgi:dihydrolipoamide dehydrogenase|uniref:Dihydrolipoyl dehydrogenase n=1 Tax=Nocardiopsis dassonvillei (strain ATCC 23218 / DSM 43111 / CIP 107115 / JCM 7437 / KCTC 9190 / NBRC 14626 / NCTC 10488 / NRRL B-5397 / IMRU 509) TaxID=446468 RepID=D7B989_NOCDD|nr:MULTISPECIES: dihydrolipoyl dehydrogenase [Nocardiopsis]ADH70747.1 dihydrolipoamide dehydrogenase [Nocardiopsis dassonvillei subsp. dassonvillei DSM 43111]MCP3015414.1 dihydrolipoyl dehydrogenase [Nocardiopsis dassonvillei]NKY78699.1 dihydrolipoyl dehydrogenase [Nocardiopsis dassonvillei]VEI90956.1 Dihydrolipoyl dehydrogenase [Nocardiopsis dassonvillei]